MVHEILKYDGARLRTGEVAAFEQHGLRTELKQLQRGRLHPIDLRQLAVSCTGQTHAHSSVFSLER